MDLDKILVAYDSNKFQVFDLHNNCSLTEWSKKNQEFPSNYLNRYNRIIGITQISDLKYILYTNYTYITVDLG